ncbi:hypothetical protein ACQ0MK_13135 [Thalassospira lucentensis]|uniref:hypothetical protein n=1 Tax=Thalassospira lucentensis TaxID=168935 RepID=UPI003D2EF1A1
MFSFSDAQIITDPVLRAQIEQHPRAQELLRAFLYPYAAPEHDFLFKVDACEPVKQVDTVRLAYGRIPVLAVGSNRAPVQLTRKFSHQNLSDEILITHGWMDHHDIVYSAHMTGYGAIPATLASSPGTKVRVAVTWLTAKQLSHMHVTESVPSHYSYQQLHGRDIELDCGLKPDHVGTYQSVAGHIFDQSDIFAVSAIQAQGRRYKSFNQWNMIEYLARRAGYVMQPEFVLRLIDDQALRTAVTTRFSIK